MSRSKISESSVLLPESAAEALHEGVDTLHPLCAASGAPLDDIWEVEAAAPARSCHGARYCRTLIVRTPRREALIVMNPGELTPALERDVRALGPVAHVLCGNALHEGAAVEWAQAFGAIVHVAPRGAGSALARGATYVLRALDVIAPPTWEEVLEQTMSSGSSLMSEVIFFHIPSRTLIVADLLQNLRPGGHTGAEHFTGAARCCIRACMSDETYGTSGDFVAPKHTRFHHSGDDIVALRERISQWPFDRVAMAHGAVVEARATAVLDEAFDNWIVECENRSRCCARCWTCLAPCWL